jgi:hypothetical protein
MKPIDLSDKLKKPSSNVRVENHKIAAVKNNLMKEDNQENSSIAGNREANKNPARVSKEFHRSSKDLQPVTLQLPMDQSMIS